MSSLSIGSESGRSFLFLQGMATQFFARLGAALRERGHSVNRVNFNGGDWLFWPERTAINFRGSLGEWPEVLSEILITHKVTDVILFGDCRPLHRLAIEYARGLRIAVYVCEEGYIRPHWVTFERDGVNGHSSLPRCAEWYLEMSLRLPPLEPMPAPHSSFPKRAWQDLIYNAAAIAFGPLYPHYQTHRPRHRLVEYAGWSLKIGRRPLALRRVRREGRRITPRSRFFLLPLQLNCDSQVRLHSPFGSMSPAITMIINSFAQHAPAGTTLVVKEHPLDDGLVNWRRMVTHLAAEAGIADRVIYLELGNLDQLIATASGLITVNSTTGTLALALGVPVMVLGTAIYDIDGLTHKAGLETFWTAPTPPDASLFIAFKQVLISRCLIGGDFFSEEGIAFLVRNAIERLNGAAPYPSAQATANLARPFLQEIAIAD